MRHPAQSFLFAASLGACSIFAVSCNCEQKYPCEEWIELGKTYQIDLGQKLTFEAPPLSTDVPFPGYPSTLHSCGTGFDIDTGDRVALTAVAREMIDERDMCDSGCYNVDAKASVPGVAATKIVYGGDVMSREFVAQSVAKVGTKCSGSYEVGLARIRPTFPGPGHYVATDYAVFRKFVPDVLEDCVAPGASYEENSFHVGVACWDVWSATVHDKHGMTPSHAFSMPMSQDASTDDSGAADESDGG